MSYEAWVVVFSPCKIALVAHFHVAGSTLPKRFVSGALVARSLRTTSLPRRLELTHR